MALLVGMMCRKQLHGLAYPEVELRRRGDVVEVWRGRSAWQRYRPGRDRVVRVIEYKAALVGPEQDAFVVAEIGGREHLEWLS